MAQVPPRSWSSMAAKTLPLSNRGRQHQSMAPSIPMSAAVRMSPIRPYSESVSVRAGTAAPAASEESSMVGSVIAQL